MIRVLHVGPNVHARGGIASVIETYARCLANESVSVRRLATVNEGTRLRKTLAAMHAYARAPLEILRADIVHVHTASRNSWRRKVPIMLLTKLYRRKLVIHIHGGGFADVLDALGSWRRRLSLRLLSQADCIVCLSAAKRAELARHVGDMPTVTIPNPSRFVPEAVDITSDGRRDILFTGWIEEAKGVFDLIRAFALIVQAYPEKKLRLVLAGKGKLDTCRELARECGIEDRVILPGWLAPAALQKLYARALIYCLPSYLEGLPMGLLEAMAYGLPTITCPVGGIPDVVDDGVQGLFVSPGNVREIATALRRLLSDPAGREAMGTAGRSRVLSRYAPEHVCGQLAQLYAALLAGAATEEPHLMGEPGLKIGSR